MWNKNQLYFYVLGKMRTCTSKSTIYNRSNKEEIRCLGINPAKKCAWPLQRTTNLIKNFK